jgi:hypothetical protein
VLATQEYVDEHSSSAPAWEFPVEDYGAVGDAFFADDVSVDGSQTFSSATIAAQGAVDMWVMIEGARGTGDTAAIGQITGISGNNVTITSRVAISATVASLPAWCGTDDTDAFNDAFVAADGVGIVTMADKRYVVASNTQSNDGNILFNSAIMIPPPADNNAGGKIVPTLRGVCRQDNTAYWNESFPNSTGSCIICMNTAPNTIDSTYDRQAVISAGTPQAGMAGPDSPPTFVNSKPVIENVKIIIPYFSNLVGFDFRYTASMYMDGWSVYAFAQAVHGNGNHMITEYSNSVWDNKNSIGVCTPISGNNADVYIKSGVAVGLHVGLRVSAEHTRIDRLVILYTQVAIAVDGGTHGLSIGHVTAEGYVGGLQFVGGGSIVTPIFIDSWSTETSGNVYDISDPGNGFHGHFNYYNITDSREMSVDGAANLQIRNCKYNTGLWSSAPELAATGVDMVNTSYCPVVVNVSGGTVTAIDIDGETIEGLTSGLVPLRPGGVLNITYSSAPTLQWFIL